MIHVKNNRANYLAFKNYYVVEEYEEKEVTETRRLS